MPPTLTVYNFTLNTERAAAFCNRAAESESMEEQCEDSMGHSRFLAQRLALKNRRFKPTSFGSELLAWLKIFSPPISIFRLFRYIGRRGNANAAIWADHRSCHIMSYHVISCHIMSYHVNGCAWTCQELKLKVEVHR